MIPLGAIFSSAHYWLRTLTPQCFKRPIMNSDIAEKSSGFGVFVGATFLAQHSRYFTGDTMNSFEPR